MHNFLCTICLHHQSGRAHGERKWEDISKYKVRENLFLPCCTNLDDFQGTQELDETKELSETLDPAGGRPFLRWTVVEKLYQKTFWQFSRVVFPRFKPQQGYPPDVDKMIGITKALPVDEAQKTFLRNID